MTIIDLGRHGQDEDNKAKILNGRRDQPLTELGRKQGRELANGILAQGLTYDAVYCSPLSRAHETAKIVCDALGLPEPVALDDLIEKDYGDMAGKPIEEIPTLCSSCLLKTDLLIGGEPLTYFLDAFNGESYPDVLERAIRVLAYIEEQHPDGRVLLICHGCIGKMIVAAFRKMDWKECLKSFHFGNSELLRLSAECGINDMHVVKQEQHNH